MKVAVIGAGISGLLAIKYAKEAGFEVDCFEQTTQIGGTWQYTEKVGLDKNGLKIHSSMYKNLLTNLPKELMGFQDYPFTGPAVSYVTPKEVMEFLEEFSADYKLKEKIKFEHFVKNVEPLSDEKWSVESKNLVTKELSTGVYDSIFICNGHFSVPNIPKIDGIENFKGKIMHSHDYRYPEPFEGQRILTIGAGPSGVDISLDLSSTAAFVAFSHHMKPIENTYPENVEQKPDVVQVLEDGTIHFYDGSTSHFDVILFCTGYKYDFPFLSPECEITVEDNHVTTLYKHIININHPTMFIIGVPFTSLITNLFDLQVRFCIKFLTGQKVLPSKDKMLEDFNADLYKRQMMGTKKRQMHKLGNERIRPYYASLAELADIEPIKPVILDLYDRTGYLRSNDYKNFRRYSYRIVDDYYFEEQYAAQ